MTATIFSAATQPANGDLVPARSLSPPAGERAGVRGRLTEKSVSTGPRQSPSSHPSPPLGEKDGMRGQPRYGQHRTRTAAARNFASHLRKKSTDTEKRLWRFLSDPPPSSLKISPPQTSCPSF